MVLLAIIIVVIALYWRTMNYYYLIDDIVRRWGFLLEIPEVSPDPNFFAKPAPKMRHFFLTLTHAINVSIIYFLWGWKAAIFFAFFPICVSCTAWVTGGYYQITTLFTLTAYFFLVKIPGLIGALLSALFFTAALGSTINCIAYPFVFALFAFPTGTILFWPLAMYLGGRRFNYGFRKRNVGKADIITWRKIFVVPKVLAYYIKNIVWPVHLAFFREMGFEYGKNPKVQQDLESPNKEFWQSLAIIAAFLAVGFFFSPLGTMWFLAGIMPFTQWKVLGQFVAERYLYIPLVGVSLIFSQIFSIHPLAVILMAPVIVYYVWRSHKYIPSFKNIESLYENGIKEYPNCISNYVNLAERRLHTGKSFEAYKLLIEGLRLDPDSFLCHANMAAYWLSINQPERGRWHTEKAIKNADNRGMAYNVFKQQLAHISQGMANMAAMQGHVDKILKDIRAEEAAKAATGQEVVNV